MRREARGPARRVPVVDDDPDARWVTAAFLGEAGCEVAEAGDGGQALAALAAAPEIGVLVTDHVMPGMDGAELVLRTREVRPGLPAMVVAGHAGAGGLACLPDDVPVVRKTFRQQDLLRALDLLRAPAGLTGGTTGA